LTFCRIFDEWAFSMSSRRGRVMLFEKDKIDKSSSPSRDSKISCWI